MAANAALARRVALAALLLAAPGRRALAEDGNCGAAIAAMRSRAAALPPGDLSRRYAEADLVGAAAELSAGDGEECLDLVERAGRTLAKRPYVLRPGEVLDGYGPDGPLHPAPASVRAAPR